MKKEIKAAAAKPVVSKKFKKKPLPAIEDYIDSLIEEGEEGKIKIILACFVKGYTRGEIIRAGYSKSTVHHQVGDYVRMKKAPVLHFNGYEMYELRIKRVMAARKCTRDEAMQHISETDTVKPIA